MDFSDVAGSERIGPVRPGEVLLEKIMRPLSLTARALAAVLNISSNRISAVVNGSRRITAETARLLGRRFGISPELWMNLQAAHDLEAARVALVWAA
jgi:antitoxin HigA-1